MERAYENRDTSSKHYALCPSNCRRFNENIPHLSLHGRDECAFEGWVIFSGIDGGILTFELDGIIRDQGFGNRKAEVRLALMKKQNREYVFSVNLFGVAEHFDRKKCCVLDARWDDCPKSEILRMFDHKIHRLELQAKAGGGGGHQLSVHNPNVKIQLASINKIMPVLKTLLLIQQGRAKPFPPKIGRMLEKKFDSDRLDILNSVINISLSPSELWEIVGAETDFQPELTMLLVNLQKLGSQKSLQIESHCVRIILSYL
eukprot:Filipodium_phascolosomae@DN2051_c0_g1_i2.p1